MKIAALAILGMLIFASTSSAQTGSALSFDGSDDRVTVPYDSSFPTDVFTITAWIKTLPSMGRAAIIARGEDDNSFNLSWQAYVQPDGTLRVMLEDQSDTNFCYPFSCMGQPQPTCTFGNLFVADDLWHHIAITRDATSMARRNPPAHRPGCLPPTTFSRSPSVAHTGPSVLLPAASSRPSGSFRD